MLDNKHRITAIYKSVEYSQQSVNILKMQAGGRFVQYEKGASRVASRQLGSKFYTLVSPPLSVDEGCPNLMYPSPMSCST